MFDPGDLSRLRLRTRRSNLLMVGQQSRREVGSLGIYNRLGYGPKLKFESKYCQDRNPWT